MSRPRLAALASLLLASACAAPKLAREWPAGHPVRPDAAGETSAPEVVSLGVLIDLPTARVEAGAHSAHGGHADPTQPAQHGTDSSAERYACPMHPEVERDRPGTCPKCGMDLEPVQGRAWNDAEVRP